MKTIKSLLLISISTFFLSTPASAYSSSDRCTVFRATLGCLIGVSKGDTNKKCHEGASSKNCVSCVKQNLKRMGKSRLASRITPAKIRQGSCQL